MDKYLQITLPKNGRVAFIPFPMQTDDFIAILVTLTQWKDEIVKDNVAITPPLDTPDISRKNSNIEIKLQ